MRFALALTALLAAPTRADEAADDLAGFGPPASSAAVPAEEAANDLAGFGPASPTNAPEHPGDADDQLGFGGGAPIAAGSEASAAEPEGRSALTLTGVARVQSSIRLERGGPYRLAQLRQGLGARLQFKHDFARSPVSVELLASGRTESDFALLMHRDAYDAPTRELYTWQLLPWESYVKLRASWFELTVGEQIVNFGQGEMLSVIDVVNPRDLREPLLTELDDLRMPLVMTRASVNWRALRIDVIAVHEAYFGLVPPPLGEFSPFRKLLLEDDGLSAALAGRELRNRHTPDRDLRAVQATQAHGRIAWSGPGVDVSLHAASVLDSFGVPGLPPPEAFEEERLELPIFHPRYTTVGAATAAPIGPVVLRGELAADLNRMLTWRRRDSSFLELFGERRTVLQGMLGLTYVPSVNTSAALEILQRYLLERDGQSTPSDAQLLLPLEATQVAFRLNHQFLRERAHVALLISVIGLSQVNAWTARAEFGYALFDALSVTLGAVTYQPSQQVGFLYGFERRDRAFLNLRWTFGSG